MTAKYMSPRPILIRGSGFEVVCVMQPHKALIREVLDQLKELRLKKEGK